MSSEKKKTEQLIQIYKEDRTEVNLRALVHQVQKTVFMVPSMMPSDIDKDEIRRMVEESGGKPAKLPEGAKPVPCVLTNPEGTVYFPLYTTMEQVPKEPHYDVIMNMPFHACLALAMHESLNAQGIVFNPFTDNLVFKKPLLEAISNGTFEQKPTGEKQVRISPAQFQVMMRQRTEFHELPLRLYKEKGAFVQKLSDEREELVNQIYHETYQNPQLYPYSERDFAVMALNISDDLQLVRVDLPDAKAPAQLCYRIYITFDPTKDEVHYFTIEKGKEKDERNLGGIDDQGRHQEYGEAPVEGAELQRIMDILKGETEQTS